MKRVHPVVYRNYLIAANCPAQLMEVVSELGIFGCLLAYVIFLTCFIIPHQRSSRSVGYDDQWRPVTLWLCDCVSVCVCVCVCPHSKRKMAWTINTKLVTLCSMAVARHALTWRSKGQRSRSHGYENRHSSMVVCGCYGRCTTAAGVGLHVLRLLRFLVSSELSARPRTGSCASKRPSSPWLRPIRQDGATYFALIGRIHGEVGRFTMHSAPLSSDEMRSFEMRWGEMRWDEMKWDEMRWLMWTLLNWTGKMESEKCTRFPLQRNFKTISV